MQYRFIFIFVFLSITVLAQVQFKDSNLPIVVVTTLQDTIRDEPAVMAQLAIIDNGKGKRNALSDAFNNYNGKAMIEYRGQTSQELSPKKPYRIELVDDNGAEIEHSIMGMPKESDWVLIAPYSDKTLIRDALVYHIGGLIMPYSPRFRFCELVVDKQYRGVYMMTEKIKRDKDRVAIDKLATDEITGDELTGGYILKWDKGKPGDTRFLSKYKAGDRFLEFFVEYPNPSDIQQLQLDYISTFIQDFEQALIGSNYLDPVKGYKKYIDIDNFVDYSLINELTFNVDAQRLSTYFYKDKDSKDPRLKAGPLWDYNLAFGNANYCNYESHKGWIKDFNLRCPGDYWAMPFWWDRFFSDNAFKSKLATRWQQLRKDTLSDAALDAYINLLSSELSEAQDRNFKRWAILNEWVWPNPVVTGSWNGEVARLKTWVKNRTQWLDNQMKLLPSDELPHPDSFAVRVFPNPSNEVIHFEIDAYNPTPLSILIYDATGKLVKTLHVDNILSDSQITITDLQDQGFYFYTILSDANLIYQGKFLKL
jgi:hypothetical protein